MARSTTKEQEILAEALRAAGVPYSRIALEVLYLLPRDFVDAYIALYHQALGDIQSTGGQPERKGYVGGKGSGGSRTGHVYKTHWFIRDEQAFRRKEWVDRRLRELVKVKKPSMRRNRKCVGCTKFLSEEWFYCPFCGREQKEQERRVAERLS